MAYKTLATALGEILDGIEIQQKYLYRDYAHKMGTTHRPVAVAKARKVVKNVLSELISDLKIPLAWERLSGIELAGRLDSELSLSLFFGDFVARVGGIYVGEKGEILQCGTQEGVLVF
jgi:hypothetical protein